MEYYSLYSENERTFAGWMSNIKSISGDVWLLVYYKAVSVCTCFTNLFYCCNDLRPFRISFMDPTTKPRNHD